VSCPYCVANFFDELCGWWNDVGDFVGDVVKVYEVVGDP
jgi:hypothetical protein